MRRKFIVLLSATLVATACSANHSAFVFQPDNAAHGDDRGIFSTIRTIVPAPVRFRGNWAEAGNRFASGLAAAQSLHRSLSAKGMADAPVLLRWKDFAPANSTTPIIDPDRAVYVERTVFTQPLETRHGVYDKAILTIAIDAETGRMLGDIIVGYPHRPTH